jgi:hypothetical protein
MLRLILLGLALVSCQTLVGSDLDTVHCEDEGAVGPPACPDGEWCWRGVCTPCDADAGCAAASGSSGAAGAGNTNAGAAGSG